MVEVEPGATHAGSCVADGAGVETFELGGRVNVSRCWLLATPVSAFPDATEADGH